MIKHDVQVKKLDPTGTELSDNFYRNCSFCEKFMRVTPSNFDSCLNIGKNEYCPFCLRNNFHYRDNKNILIFSFRGIVGYYYYKFYKIKSPEIWVSQIESNLDLHARIGLDNPALSYDPHTFLWFANFNKIGVDRYKAPFDEVISVIESMFNTFQVKEKFGDHVDSVLKDRFLKATKLFYKQRKRPKDRRMLIPTFSQIINPPETEEFYEQTRNFNHTNLLIK